MAHTPIIIRCFISSAKMKCRRLTTMTAESASHHDAIFCTPPHLHLTCEPRRHYMLATGITFPQIAPSVKTRSLAEIMSVINEMGRCRAYQSRLLLLFRLMGASPRSCAERVAHYRASTDTCHAHGQNIIITAGGNVAYRGGAKQKASRFNRKNAIFITRRAKTETHRKRYHAQLKATVEEMSNSILRGSEI